VGTDRKTAAEPEIIPAESPAQTKEDRLKPYQFQPGESGNPGGQPAWKRTVMRVFGDGEPVYRAMNELAQGNVVYGIDRNPETGDVVGYVKIVPNAYSMIGAANFISDRATGKPTMTVQRASEDQASTVGVQRMYDDLTPEEQQVLRMIAQRAAKMARTVAGGAAPRLPAPPTVPIPKDDDDA